MESRSDKWTYKYAAFRVATNINSMMKNTPKPDEAAVIAVNFNTSASPHVSSMFFCVRRIIITSITRRTALASTSEYVIRFHTRGRVLRRGYSNDAEKKKG